MEAKVTRDKPIKREKEQFTYITPELAERSSKIGKDGVAGQFGSVIADSHAGIAAYLRTAIEVKSNAFT